MCVREEQAHLEKKLQDLESKVIAAGVSLVSQSYITANIDIVHLLTSPTWLKLLHIKSECIEKWLFTRVLYTTIAEGDWEAEAAAGEVTPGVGKEEKEGVYSQERTWEEKGSIGGVEWMHRDKLECNFCCFPRRLNTRSTRRSTALCRRPRRDLPSNLSKSGSRSRLLMMR